MAEFTSVSAILKDYGLKIIAALKKNLEGHNASYQLQQSIDFAITIYNSTYTLSIQMDDYWKYLEYGRKGGKFPPPDAILKWTAQKGFSMNQVAQQLGIKGKINRDSVRKQLTFLIGRKIAKFGTPATHFASKALGQDFIETGGLTAPIWVNMKNDLAEVLKKDIEIQVISFRK